MDIVEFVERFMGTELREWQKNAIRILYETDRNARIHICMPKHHGRDQQMYIYMNQKELVPNGKTNDCK